MATEALVPAPLFSLEAFNRLSARQKILMMVAVAFAVALVVGGLLWARTPDYGILFSGLSEKDGGQIIAALQQQNIPFKVSEGGTTILVPSPVVAETRLKLASQGLPKGGLVGFEVMENQKLGASQFLEQVNYQRALEGELARSIQSLGAVRGARVHLAIPKQSAFLRDEQKPTASVLVAMNAGRVLDPGQVAGIVHLVSSSVPELSPGNVSVIDQDGNLISQPTDATRAGLDPTQIKYVRDLEQSYIKRIESILSAVTGPGNVKAQVAADVDFSQTEQVAETYKPNPQPTTAIRSQQSSESASNEPGPAGVPGALSNQPPVPATAPLTTPPAPGTPGGTQGRAAGPTNFNKSSTVNYEVDKTVSHVKGAPGMVRRLSVAVVVNHRKAANGRLVALGDTEMKQINELTREAMGFDKTRGDTLNVANVPFITPESVGAFETPWWKDPDVIAWATMLGKLLLVAVAGVFAWKKVLKPLFEQMQHAAAQAASHRAAALAAAGLEPSEAESAAAARAATYETKVDHARQMAKQDPKLVAGVIKEWIGGTEQR